jgi:L,D-transpeptidase catalytic domain
VKRLAAVLALLANFLPQYAFAESTSTQPLTRVDCVRAGIEWDENANICTGSLFKESSQALTRGECAAAHSTWNENANVCDGEPSSSAEVGSSATLPKQGSILVNIDKSKQRMTVFVNGIQRYQWPVSTGVPGYSTPSGTYTASSMNEIGTVSSGTTPPCPTRSFSLRRATQFMAPMR